MLAPTAVKVVKPFQAKDRNAGPVLRGGALPGTALTRWVAMISENIHRNIILKENIASECKGKMFSSLTQ